VNEGKTKYIKCGTRETKENTLQLKKVQSFKYLGCVVNQNNEIEEVKEIINAGKKALHAKKKKMFQCKLLSKISKLRLYW
jgi:hypothetical protein